MRKINSSLFYECVVVYILIASFFFSAIFTTGLFTGSHRRKIAILIVLILFSILLLIMGIKYKAKKMKILSLIKNNIPLLILIIFSFIIRVPQLGTAIRWDSSVYYSQLIVACESFDFTIGSFIKNFGLAGHPTYAYAAGAAIFEFLFPRQTIGVQIYQLILSVAVCLCIYLIIRKCTRKSQMECAIGAGIVSCSPVFLGTYSYFHVDFGIAVFTIFVICTHIYKKYLLFSVACICLVFTKETGIVLLFGYFLFYVLSCYIHEKGKLIEKVKNIFCKPVVLIMMVIGGVGAIYLFLSIFVFKSGWGGSVEFVDNSSQEIALGSEMIGYFSFQVDYILFKIQQMITSNFAWLSLLIVLIIIIIKKKQKKMGDIYLPIIGGGGAICFFLLFSCVYVTFTLIRYNIVVELFINLFLGILVVNCFSKYFVYVISSSLIGLFCLQGYLSIDPIMGSFGQRLETGGTPLILSNIEETTYYGDYLVYNYHYSYLDRGLQKIFTEIQYDQNTDIVLCGNSEALFLGGAPNVPHKIGWNTVLNKFSFEQEGNILEINPIPMDSLQELKEADTLKDRAVIILVPYYYTDKKSVEKQISNFYQNITYHNIQIGLYGEMDYILMDLK